MLHLTGELQTKTHHCLSNSRNSQMSQGDAPRVSSIPAPVPPSDAWHGAEDNHLLGIHDQSSCPLQELDRSLQAGNVWAYGIHSLRLRMQTDTSMRKVFRPFHRGRLPLADSILRGALLGDEFRRRNQLQKGESPFLCALFRVSLVAVECRLDDGG